MNCKRILSFVIVLSILVSGIIIKPVDVFAYEEAYELPEMTGDQAVDIVNIANSQLGYNGADGTVYGAWWNTITNWGHNYIKEPWCAMFACWCADKAGIGIDMAFNKSSAMCKHLFEFLKENGTYDTTFETEPRPGDFIFFGPKGGSSNHVAICVDYNPGTKMVTVIGGNQGSAAGGTVTKGICTWKVDAPWGSKVVLGYGRPNYTVSDPVHKPVGELESVVGANNSFIVRGWAYDEDAKNDSVEIKIYLNGELVDTALADKNRDDIIYEVDGEEIQLSGKYGFEHKVSYKPDDTSECEVTVFAVDTNGRYDDVQLPGEFKNVEITATPFEDVGLEDYFYEPVIWAVENEITTGISDIYFGPDNNCTRGQAITFLWRLEGNKSVDNSNAVFDDVSKDAYYYDAVVWAAYKNIFEGSSFRPEDTVTRAEFVEFLWRLAGMPEPGTTENQFTDIKDTDVYYKAVLWAVEQGITTGTGDARFEPNGECTRGQIVTFLFRYADFEYKIINDKIIIVGIRDNSATDVIIPEEFRGLPVVGFEKELFANTEVQRVVLPDTISEIPDYAFENCTKLESVKLPNTLIKVGNGAFKGCSSLKNIVIPELADTFGVGVFVGCDLLKTAGPVGGEYDIQFGWVEEIPDNAFYNSNINYVQIPDSVKRIGNNAFYACDELTSIYLPNSIETIDAAFKRCTALEKIMIPKSVESINRNAFLGCNNELIIHCYRDSYGLRYAQMWNMPYVLVDPFVDVTEDSYYYHAVNWSIEERITNGIDEGHFGPDEECNRAESITFIWRALGSPEPTVLDNPFEDVEKDDYYYKAVLWALENGVTTGTDATHFGPDDVVTRGHFVTFLWRASGEPLIERENEFEDVLEDDYYYYPVLWALENSITTGTDDTHFTPSQKCNRAQVVTFLFRAVAE